MYRDTILIFHIPSLDAPVIYKLLLSYLGTRKQISSEESKGFFFVGFSANIDNMGIPFQIICNCLCLIFSWRDSAVGIAPHGIIITHHMSLVMRKPALIFAYANREADQRICYCHTDNAILFLSKSEISSLKPSSVTAQTGFCRTLSETPKTGFLTTRLI